MASVGAGRNVRGWRDDAGMPALFVNAYPVTFEGDVTLWRMPRAEADDKRRLEGELGMALWGERDAFWSTREPRGCGATSQSFPAADPRGRVLFAAREALVDHAHAGNRDAWFGRAGEMSFLGLLPSQDTDRFVLEPQLVARLVQERYVDAHAAVVVRARTRWRSRETLDSAEVARIAVGEPAVRLTGTGPRRGEVVSLANGELILRTGPERHTVVPGDYALVTGSRLVVAWRGQQVFRQLQIASGVLTVANKRNRYAVKDRFEIAGRMLRGIGWPIPLPGSGQMLLGKPINVQMEGAE
jgi:hypothetical protein